MAFGQLLLSSQPFFHKNLGQLASIGHHTAVAKILGMRFPGLFAWWIWRTVYLFKLPGLQRKLRVMMDWTMDFFPRDISVLLPGPTELLQEMHLEIGNVVFHAGEPTRSFYILTEGRVDLFEGDRRVKSVTAGQHFGERAMAGDGVARFSAMAAPA